MRIVFNPAAGPGRLRRLWRVRDILAAHGVRAELAETACRGHATLLAREAARAGATLVVAAGGDGTITEVAAGLAGTACRLGILPLGTANVLAHELDLPTDAAGIAACLAFGRTRPVWPGQAEGPDIHRGFVQMLGAGFDAQVVARLSPLLKHALGRSAYVLQTLRESARYPFPRIALRLDGEPCEAGSVIVTKGRFYAGPYVLAPGRSAGAPGLTVALFARASPAAVLEGGLRLLRGSLASMPGLELRAARRVEILTPGLPVQTDGEAAGLTPCVITDASAPISVVVA